MKYLFYTRIFKLIEFLLNTVGSRYAVRNPVIPVYRRKVPPLTHKKLAEANILNLDILTFIYTLVLLSILYSMMADVDDVTVSGSSDIDTDTEEDFSASDDQNIILTFSRSTVSILSSCAINLFLPFINGMMLGFGEIFAHELGFKWGFTGARVRLSS